jgi:hypothetical protein
MVYSICLFDESDFKSIGRKIPKGTGVDNSISDGTKATNKERLTKIIKKRKRDDETNTSLFQAINKSTEAESKMVALRLMVEFGTASKKSQALTEIQKVAELEKDKDDVETASDKEEQDGDFDYSNESE